jgi:hypothetical protein
MFKDGDGLARVGACKVAARRTASALDFGPSEWMSLMLISSFRDWPDVTNVPS